MLPSVPVPDWAVDAGRGQLIAERLIDAIAATDVVIEDPEAVVIGLTNVDMYIAARDWRLRVRPPREGHLRGRLVGAHGRWVRG